MFPIKSCEFDGLNALSPSLPEHFRAWNWHLVVQLSPNRLPWHRRASPSATLDGIA